MEENAKKTKRMMHDLKIIVVGDNCTGKTCLCSKYTKNTFIESYQETIVSNFNFKIVFFKNDGFRLQIWNLGGKDEKGTIAKIFAKDADGCIFVCNEINNIKDRTKILELQRYINNTQYFDNGNFPGVLVQNKSDLFLEDDTNEDLKLRAFAMKFNFSGAFRTSAKTGFNVNESFEFLFEEILIKKKLLNENERRRSLFLKATMPQEDVNKYFVVVKEPPMNESGEDLDVRPSIQSYDSRGSICDSLSDIEFDFFNTSDDAILEEDLQKDLYIDNNSEDLINEEETNIVKLEIQQKDKIYIPKQITYKVTVIGDCKVGKTSYINRLTKNIYDDEYNQTTSVQSKADKVIDKEGLSYKIELYDTVSSTNNSLISKLFIKDTDGIIIMCDATKEDNSLQWKKKCCENNTPYIVIYNKIDLLPKKKDKLMIANLESP